MPVVEERLLASCLDFTDALHGLDGGLDEVAVVADGNVATFLKLERRILWIKWHKLTASSLFQETYDSHLLAGCFPKGLCPLHFTRISSQLEVAMTSKICMVRYSVIEWT